MSTRGPGLASPGSTVGGETGWTSPPGEGLRVLCLGFWAPPTERPQAILLGKILPEWLRQGLRPMLLTYAGQGEWSPGAPVRTLPRRRRSRWAKILPPLAHWEERRYRRSLFDLAREAVETHRPEVVFAFANPQESNLLGAELKERLGIPFVSHFSDPFVDCPLKNLQGRRRRLAMAEEAFIVERSDRIVFVNDALKRLVMAKYPASLAHRAVVVPHCFDPALYLPEATNPAAGRTGTPFVLSHIGAFYRQRHPGAVFAALATLKSRIPDLGERLRLTLIGGTNPYAGFAEADLAALIDRHGLGDCVRCLPSMPYRESLWAMGEADALLLLDAEVPDSPFLPSKLIDYLGSGRPLLALADPDSPSGRLVREVGGVVVAHGDTTTLTAVIAGMVAGHSLAAPAPSVAAAYAVASTTRRLCEIFAHARMGGAGR
ncbi:MAG: glycosyltransferase [Magnetococcales bacterium]|nr:glycosyltransferase [Magnetococcales bacterium]MBF0155898.1 glycosyltransferase [Magnetococcales bacterium]